METFLSNFSSYIYHESNSFIATGTSKISYKNITLPLFSNLSTQNDITDRRSQTNNPQVTVNECFPSYLNGLIITNIDDVLHSLHHSILSPMYDDLSQSHTRSADTTDGFRLVLNADGTIDYFDSSLVLLPSIADTSNNSNHNDHHNQTNTPHHTSNMLPSTGASVSPLLSFPHPVAINTTRLHSHTTDPRLSSHSYPCSYPWLSDFIMQISSRLYRGLPTEPLTNWLRNDHQRKQLRSFNATNSVHDNSLIDNINTTNNNHNQQSKSTSSSVQSTQTTTTTNDTPPANNINDDALYIKTMACLQPQMSYINNIHLDLQSNQPKPLPSTEPEHINNINLSRITSEYLSQIDLVPKTTATSYRTALKLRRLEQSQQSTQIATDDDDDVDVDDDSDILTSSSILTVARTQTSNERKHSKHDKTNQNKRSSRHTLTSHTTSSSSTTDDDDDDCSPKRKRIKNGEKYQSRDIAPRIQHLSNSSSKESLLCTKSLKKSK